MQRTLFAPFLLTAALSAQQPASSPSPSQSAATIRVFLAGSEPERIAGEALLGDSRGALNLTRTAPSYDIESMRVFAKNCPAVTMTTARGKASIILRIEREEINPFSPFVKGNRIALFNLEGDLLYTTRARRLTNAAKNTCQAVLQQAKR